MAAYCPKCNYKLKLSDWRPECPKCGVNVVYYGIEERLRQEADVAEHHYAVRKPKIDRIKFSMIGHPLAIVRLVLGLLPIVALLLPSGRVEYVLPFHTHAATVNLISVITFFSDNGFDFDLLTSMFGSPLLGKAFVYFAIALVGMALMALTALVGFILLTLSCSPHGFQRNVIIPTIGMAFATVSFVFYCLMIAELNRVLPGIFTGSVQPWAYVAAMLVFAAMIVINVIYKKKNIPVKYTDVSELLLPYDERPSTKEKQKAQPAREPRPA